MDQLAAAGLPHGGSRRPFGYDADRVTVREQEADVIRSLADRFVSGESLRSLTTWLEASEFQAVGGGVWRSGALRAVLTSARIAGLRSHRGQVIGPAQWKPIITEQQHDRILSRLAQITTTHQRSPRRYLLSGLLRCGRCRKPLLSSPSGATRRYACVSGPDHGGCGRLTVVAEPVEELITEAVLFRLDTPKLSAALDGSTSGDSQTIAMGQGLADDRAQLDELAALYAGKEITSREWLTARQPIEARIRQTETALARATKSSALTGLAGQGVVLRTRWASLNLTRQHAIVAAVLDHVVIGPGTPGVHHLDPERVLPRWRL